MASSLDKISANSKTIGSILKEQYLEVPTNQRNYAWERKHAKELFTDLKDAIANESSEYFLGSIVLMEHKGRNHLVADGQQRLATTLILLAAIRNYHTGLGDKDDADKLQKSFLLTEEYGEAESIPHLRLNEKDHEYFYQRILLSKGDSRRNEEFVTKPEQKSHKRIDNAAKEAEIAVKNIVQGFRPEQYFSQLTRWVNFLLKQTIVVVVLVPDESAAYTIFETMNDRGLTLSAVDLIKNYLFGKASTSFETVKHNWTTMMGALDTVKEEDVAQSFVRHFWISQNGVVRSPQLFTAIKKNVSTPNKTVSLSVDLSTASTKYIALLTPSHPFWASFGKYTVEIRKNLEILNLFGVKQVRPLLLASLDKFTQKDITNLLYLSVAWTVRLIISGTQGTGELETLYGNSAHQIYKKELKSIAAIGKFMKKAVPSDEDFKKSFADTEVKQAALARYYLRSLERQSKGDPQASFIPTEEGVITLEHILPKDFHHYRGEWTHITNDKHEVLTYRLGNQVLLTEKDNGAIGSRGYPFKQPILAKSDFALTKKAGKYSEWDETQIEDRQKELAELAISTWSLTLKY